MPNRSVGLIVVTQSRDGKEALLRSASPRMMPETFRLTCDTTVADGECNEEALERVISCQLGYEFLCEARRKRHCCRIVSDVAVHGPDAVIYGMFGSSRRLRHLLGDSLRKGVIKPVQESRPILPLSEECKIWRCSRKAILMQRGDAIALRQAFQMCH